MIQLDQILLLAADDWWQIVGTIIVFLFYGVGHLISGREDAQKRAKQKARRVKRPPAERGPQGQPPNQADPLRAEVEEFLRRAEGKQPAAESARDRELRERNEGGSFRDDRARGREESPPMREVVAERSTPRPPQPKPRKRRPAKPAQRPSQPVPEAKSLRSEGVAEHVARHLSRKSVTESAEQLGDEVALADDIVEARLHDTFEHQVGQLEHREDQASQSAASVADEVRQLLSNPQGMRQLIVANEVLRRPEERW